MAISRDTLGDGEEVVLHMHTHGKALIWPAVALIVFSAALGVGIALLPISTQPWGTWLAVGVFVFLVIWMVVLPFLRWFTSTYTVTDRRIITRRGILNKTGHDLPLRRINNVNYDRSLIDRLLGCGTLTLETAAGQPLVLHDLPRVEQVHMSINNLLFRRNADRHDDGEPSSLDD
ncbi:MAG: PH domain-containing protein [Propionibacteriaceae bacterium]|nr:PH domain-containing protein [Propionibacteriaceae bacterium]